MSNFNKKIKNKNILKYYGFNYKNDKNIFSNGLKINISGICDLIVSKFLSNYNYNTQITNKIENENTIKNDLFEIKTCLKNSFSNEWVLQISIYNILLELVDKTKIDSNYIINLFDGSIYKIKFKSNIQILKNILKLYDFDDYLLNLILSS